MKAAMNKTDVTPQEEMIHNSGILILPRTQVLQRLFLLPTRKAKEIEQVLAYRIPAETPFLATEITWTWRVVHHLSDGQYLVCVLIVEKRRLQCFLDDAKVGAGIRGLLVEDEFLSIWRTGRTGSVTEVSADRAASAEVAQDNESTVTNALSGEAHFYRIPGRVLGVHMIGGHCLRSYVKPVNGTDSYAAVVEQLLTELSTTPLADDTTLSTDNIRDPKRCRLQAGDNLWPDIETNGVAQDLENPLWTVTNDPPETLSWRRKEKTLIPLASGGWILHSRTLSDRKLGSRLRAAARLDLLPARWSAGHAGRRITSWILLVAMLGVIAALAGSYGANKLADQAQASRELVDQARARLTVDLEQVQAAQMLVASVEDKSSTGRVILAAWDQVSEAVPRGMLLTGLTIRTAGSIQITGTAPDREAVIELMEVMRGAANGFFSEVLLGGLEERSGKQIFNIQASIANPDGEVTP